MYPLEFMQQLTLNRSHRSIRPVDLERRRMLVEAGTAELCPSRQRLGISVRCWIECKVPWRPCLTTNR